MARPQANNVDYFPCYCKDGKTLYILESRWGNAGYAFFYKLWKRIGDADHHYIDLRPLDNWEYFRAKMGVSDAETTDILNKLAEMGVIDPELWSNKVIWSDSFIESVKDVWTKRKQLIPQKPLFLIQKPTLPEQEHHTNNELPPIFGNRNPQSKVNESKVNEINKGPADAPFELPTKEEIQESSDPKLEEDIGKVCQRLYEDKIFPEVNAFKNKMRKNKKNLRAILHVLSRCYLSKPDDPWAFCQKIIQLEDLNYNERDYRKAAQ